jgi:hypothetical protein
MGGITKIRCLSPVIKERYSVSGHFQCDKMLGKRELALESMSMTAMVLVVVVTTCCSEISSDCARLWFEFDGDYGLRGVILFPLAYPMTSEWVSVWYWLLSRMVG